MDSAQAVSETEEVPSSISTVPEKANSLFNVQVLIRVMLVVGWLMILAEVAGLVMVLLSYHENLGAFMVFSGLFGGAFFIVGALFLRSKIASKSASSPDQR